MTKYIGTVTFERNPKKSTHTGIVVVKISVNGIPEKVSETEVRIRETPKYWITDSGLRYSKHKGGWCASFLGARLDLLSTRRIRPGQFPS